MKIFLLLLLLTTNAFASEKIANDCKRPNWDKQWIKNAKGELCITNTRHWLLYVEGTDVVVNHKCMVVAGKWKSFYSGVEITDPKNIQIDHVMPWAEMKRRGVCKLKTNDIIDFYNDSNNLVIATTNENQQKSDKFELPFEVSEEVKKEYKNKLFMFCLSRFSNCNIYMQ